MKNSTSHRQVQQILHSRSTSDGDGVRIQRTLGQHRHDMDPFLMLDEIRSVDSADYVGGPGGRYGKGRLNVRKASLCTGK